MFKPIMTIFTLGILVSSCCYADEFTFAPKGMFISPEANATIAARASWSADFRFQMSGKSPVDFSGPIFPGYKMPKAVDTQVNVDQKQVVAKQRCEAFDADITKTLTLVNGAILNRIHYKAAKPINKDVMYRIFFPLESFAGADATCNGKALHLPKDKTAKYILAQGTDSLELRINLDENLQLGIKLISGFSYYSIADCRHHGNPEKHFHLYIKMDGNDLQYMVSLLKKDEPFPGLEPIKDQQSRLPQTPQNLLGQGSGFEVGPHGLIPFAYYSWSEAWAQPATQLPTFDSQEKVEGRYSMRLEADDMKKVDGRFNMNAVIFNRVRLDPAKTYTLSAWLKSDANLKATLDCKEKVWTGTAGKVINVTDRWQRYAYTFKPTEYKLLNDATAWVGIHPAETQGRLWIDAVQLEEGDVSDYIPQPLAFGAQITEPYKLFTVDQYQSASMKWSFRNNTTSTITSTIRYQILDYWDQVVFKKKVVQSISADDNLSMDIALPELPLGYYRVRMDDQTNALHDEASFGIYEPVAGDGKLPMDWPLGCDASEGNPLVRDLGFSWTRAWGFTFKRTCPTAKTFNFRETDIVVDRCEKAGLNLMPILGVGFGRAPWMAQGHDHIPDWAVKEIRKSNVKNAWSKEVYFPTIKAWKHYVKAVVGRYKGRIKVWEVLNEPNCWVTSEEYVPYLQAAYEAAKEANPDCLIVGGCATSDWNGEPAPWTQRVLELDKCQSMDVLSIHMYSDRSPEDYLHRGSDRFLEDLKKMVQSHGRQLPIWHTEKSHNTTKVGYTQKKHGLAPVYLKEPGFRVDNFQTKARYLIRESLIDFAVGKGPFFWFGNMPNNLHIGSHRKSYGLQHIEYDNSPTPELIAANAMARMLVGRNQPVKLTKLGVHVYSTMYEGPKGVLLALWDAKEKSKIKTGNVRLPFEAYQFFGVKIPMRSSESIELGPDPIYLVFNNATAKQVTDWLSKVQTSGKQMTFSGGLERDGEQVVLAVYARNLTSNTLSTTLNVDPQTQDWQLQSHTRTQSCKGSTYTRFAFPVSRFGKTGQPAKFAIKYSGQTSFLSIPAISSSGDWHSFLGAVDEVQAKARSASNITIDGDLRDWQEDNLCVINTSEQVLSGRSAWQDPSDLSAAARFAWDAKSLYLAINVADDVFERNCPIKQGYNSDGMEFFIGTSMKENRQIFLAAGMPTGQYKQAQAWCKQTQDDAEIQIQSKQTASGYVMEAAIPWQAVFPDFQPAVGKKLIMSFQICDSDQAGASTEKTIVWQGSAGNWLNPERWGNVVLQ